MNASKKLSLPACALSVVALAGCGSISGSDEYPQGEITMIIPFGPGGSTDPIGRQYAEHLEEELDTSVAVLNREGGGSAVGTTEIAQASPDGYTIGLCVDGSLALTPQLQDLEYSVDDLELITALVTQPANLAVHADAPWQDLEEFVEYAQENPGEIQLGNSGAVSQTDLEIRKLSDALDTDIQSIDFAGGGEALTALLGGRIDGVIGRGPTVAGNVEAGELRVLGTYNETEYPFLPDATPFAELGYDMPQTPEIVGICAPADLPDDVRDALVEASQNVTENADFNEYLEQNGYVPTPMPPEEYSESLEEYIDVYGEIIEEHDLA
ncbi:tripartite tricarboxylate transporter substrate binding protein [Spiractinospora alimapuensis]|uniref:Bug family tripartite tricarboxylate transporter substrate binding protein n=1 Tax=Spiractinospora alimapuensis TaxID=2820884 RepID=UPI001F30C60B|nr:tripartite tricarboxylate transporter substrate binding protein [Spiractinospora alimapuensis]QVQ52276.1 tripartite tricarboxylate transporter substrate binding protein [Spiractinospora alimapuensis]